MIADRYYEVLVPQEYEVLLVELHQADKWLQVL